LTSEGKIDGASSVQVAAVVTMEENYTTEQPTERPSRRRRCPSDQQRDNVVGKATVVAFGHENPETKNVRLERIAQYFEFSRIFDSIQQHTIPFLR
jgi:hypothetical protein